MQNELRNYATSCLIAFVVSLLVFSTVMPRFSVYLTVLCAAVWICILMYGKRDNTQFFRHVFLVGLGNTLAFAAQWHLQGCEVSFSNIDVLEAAPLVLLFIGTAYVVGVILIDEARDWAKHSREWENDTLQLFPERADDLLRLKGFLQDDLPIIGVDAHWGDGKTFLIDRLCALPEIRGRYEIVRINVLAGNEDEIELALMNEFDRILRRNHIFSLASKQMLKLLESNDVLKQLQWLLIDDTQSVSTTFSSILSDLEKLDKKVLIIVDDIERLGDDILIRKLFALAESVSSRKVQIIYLLNSLMLTGFDRVYLEKYIPCYMGLTPVRFESIVEMFWGELQMDAAGLACKDVKGIVDSPPGNYSIANILALDLSKGLRPFDLDHATIRMIRVFLEEFRDLVRQRRPSDREIGTAMPKAEQELLLKCIFIKHFLNDDFERIVIGTSVIDCLLFRLNEGAKEILRVNGLEAPDHVALPFLFEARRRLDCVEDMRSLMDMILEDKENYNRLRALMMLGFDYTDQWKEIQSKERSGKAPEPAPTYDADPKLRLLMRAEQIGNEHISNIERERNNERIDRVMWNLIANGTSELANLDAHVRHFQEIILTAALENPQMKWQKFSDDAYQGKIYKDNVTRNRIGIDSYLPLFQGFSVTNATPEWWLKLLDFYFQSDEGQKISVEMVQNLNYVEMMNRKVYIAVLKLFTESQIAGNLNEEPCMYRFLKRTLRTADSLGYTRNYLFHSLRYLADKPVGAEELIPSQRWKDAVMEIAGQLEDMKDGLEHDKLGIPGLSWFDSDLDIIIRFIDKCITLIAEEKPLKMGTFDVKVTARSVSQHEDLVHELEQELEDSAGVDEWCERVHSSYEKGELHPSEVRELAEKWRERTESCAPNGELP